MFRFTGKAPAQFRVLGGDANRTGVQVAFAHHDAAFNDQRCRGEAEFIGAQQGTYHDIAAGTHTAINLYRYTAAQVIHDQGLVGFCQSDFPG